MSSGSQVLKQSTARQDQDQDSVSMTGGVSKHVNVHEESAVEYKSEHEGIPCSELERKNLDFHPHKVDLTESSVEESKLNSVQSNRAHARPRQSNL